MGLHSLAIGNTHLIVPGNRPPWDLLFPELAESSGDDAFKPRKVFSPLENPPGDGFLLPEDYRAEEDELIYEDTEDFDDACIPVMHDISRKLGQFTKPFLTVFAPADPLLGWAG